jgi:hypothetical protein
MPFSKAGPNTYVSDEGYSVEIIATAEFPAVTLRYREGDHTMDVWAEAMATPRFVIDLSSTRRWAPPHHRKRVSKADRERVMTRTEAAMAFAGFVTDRYPES